MRRLLWLPTRMTLSGSLPTAGRNRSIAPGHCPIRSDKCSPSIASDRFRSDIKQLKAQLALAVEEHFLVARVRDNANLESGGTFEGRKPQPIRGSQAGRDVSVLLATSFRLFCRKPPLPSQQRGL